MTDKERYKQAFGVLHASDDIDLEAKMKENRKRMIPGKKLVACAAVAVMTMGLGITAAASSGLFFTKSNGTVSDEVEYKDLSKLEQEVGFDVRSVESFSNGYKFNAAGKSASEIYSEDGDVVGTYDELNLVYENAEGKDVYLNAFPADKELAGDEETVHAGETEINGIKVAYDETAIKVSSDGSADGETYVEVVETEDGKLVTTQAGGDENVKINEMSDICWIQDGIRYQLTSVDGVMSFEEMQEMAKEIIEAK